MKHRIVVLLLCAVRILSAQQKPSQKWLDQKFSMFFISVFTRTTEVCMTESPLPGVTANKFNLYFFVNLIPDYTLQKSSNYRFQRLYIP